MVAAIVVKIELGHIAQVRDVPNLDGHTHDWMVFVKGADGIDIEHFVEKVVFYLHDSYNPSKYVIKTPPYEVKQTGYAGFNILINVHFKNKSEPKYVSFNYDMFLHMENMPPVNHTRIEMLTFSNPAEDFKKKLIRAGGVVQPLEGAKEKKQKEPGHSESKKHRTSHEGDKKVKSSQKSHKQKTSSKDESKRRSSITEADLIKKKKIEEKLNSSAPVEKKPREKLNKLKIKIGDKGNPPSLFSREESIDIKQIMKKDPGKKDDSKRPSEKRPSPPEIKVKKEESDKTERFPEKKKKDKKQSSAPKVKQELKQKKRRTMSSSDTDAAPPKRSDLLPSESDSEEERRARKKHKKEKTKESKKVVKKMRKEEARKPSPLPPKRDNTELMDMDICETPPHDTFASQPESSQPRSGAANSAKEKRHKSSKPRDKSNGTSANTTSHNKDAFSNASPQVKRKSEKSSSHARAPHKDQPSSQPPKKNRSKPTPSREPVLHFTSDSDSSDSEIDRPSSRQQVFKQELISPIRSSSESPSPVHTPLTSLLRPKDDVMSHSSDDAMSASSRDAAESESDGDLFEEQSSPPVGSQKNYTEEKKRPGEISPVAREPSPLVTVSVGSELKSFPGLNADLFEQLKQLQNALSQISDVAVMKKVASIVRKSGRFAMDGDAMDFDLCALDRKTIHKIQKHLKVY